eukprot:m.114691 g.114691  ORF g.114691 m.114691 type:complete len:638 (-) comp14177_c1_seq1:261-2174(-)
MSYYQSKIITEFVAHSKDVKCVSIGKSHNIIATGGDDKAVNIWGIHTGQCLQPLSGHTSSVESVALDHDEKQVVGGSASGSLRIWSLKDGKIVSTLTGHKSKVWSLDWHPYGNFVASGCADTCRVWDIRRKGCLQAYKGHKDVIRCLQFTPDGKWIVSGSDDNTIKIWDLTAGKMLKELCKTGPVTSLDFHPEEFLLASASANPDKIEFWDLERFEPVSSANVDSARVCSVAFSQNGQRLFSGSQDSFRTYTWEPFEEKNKQIVPWGKVLDMAAGPDSVIAASASQNKISIWSVTAANGPPPKSPIPPIPSPVPSPTKTITIKTSPSKRSKTPTTTAKPTSTTTATSESKTPAPIVNTNPASTTSRGEPVKARSPILTPNPTPTPSPAIAKSVTKSVVEPSSATPVSNSTIPADRGTPIGLNMEAFLPRKAADTPIVTDPAEALIAVQQDHGSMIQIMSLRLQNVQVVKKQLESGNFETALETMLTVTDSGVQQDQGVVVDVLGVLCDRPNDWNLNMAALVLPKCVQLLASPYDSHVEMGRKTVMLIIKTFRDVIKSNLRRPPTHGGVDISREERWIVDFDRKFDGCFLQTSYDRYNKCVQCNDRLKDIRVAISPRLKEAGQIGSWLRELDKALGKL